VTRSPMLPPPNGRIADRIVDPASCAVVAFGVGGIPEAVGDPSLGILVRPRDTDGLVTAPSRLCDASAVAASERVRDHHALGSRLPLIPQANGMEIGPAPGANERPAEDRDD
jgi:hypothetical protein